MRYHRRRSSCPAVFLFAVAVAALVLVFVAPFFAWGKHAQIDDLSQVIQMHHPVVARSAPPETIEATPAYVSAAAYYENGQRLDIQRRISGACGPGRFLDRVGPTGDLECTPDLRGAPLGLATLNAQGKVPAEQLEAGYVAYQGTWNASTPLPTGVKGHYYVVSTSASTWAVGDWAIFNGVVWEKADHSDSVSSVAGKVGAVTLDAADVASGAFADARISTSSVTQHTATVQHQDLLGAGSFSHFQIDGHITDDGKHRQINDTGSAATDLWSAAKILSELSGKANAGHVIVAADVSDFDAATDARITTQKGAANGLATTVKDVPVRALATLDGAGRIPAAQLPLGGVVYEGSWNAATNTPALVSSTGTQGHYYVVSVSGSTNLDGVSLWSAGDWAIFSGTVWEKTDNSESVTSVAGKQGAVTLAAGDIASGSFANARISESSVTQHQGALAIAGSQVTANPALSGYVELSDAAAPTNPGAGKGRLYKKTGNDGLFWKPDAAGSEIDLSASSGMTLDAQAAVSATAQSTTSTDWVDMPDMAITTSNAAATTYQMSFSCTFQISHHAQIGSIIINVDGVDYTAAKRRFSVANANADHSFSTGCMAFNIPNGKVIKIKYKTSGGTLTVYERVLTIYGWY